MVSELVFNSWLQEIGVGIYDILDADADEQVEAKIGKYLPQSTEQIVKIKPNAKDSSSSSSSDDDDLYLNFASDEDDTDIIAKIKEKARELDCGKSATTKATAKKVLI